MPYLLGSASQNSPGRLGRFKAVNRSMTQAEHALYFKEGVATADRNASQVPVYTSDFSAGTDAWTVESGVTLTGNVDAIAGEDNWLKIDITGSGPRAKKSIPALTNLGAAGSKVRFGVRIYSTSNRGVFFNTSTATAGQVGFTAYKNNLGGQVGFSNSAAIAPNGSIINIEAEAVVNAGGSVNLVLWFLDGGGYHSSGEWYIKLVKIEQVGQTVNLAPPAIQLTPGQWLESVNKAHVFLPDGARAQEPKRTGMLYGTNTFSSSAVGQPLQNVDWHIVPADAGVTLRMKATVSATFNIGDGSNATRYASAVTIGTDWTNITIANPSSDGTNRKIVITPTASYNGVVTTAARVDLLS